MRDQLQIVLDALKDLRDRIEVSETRPSVEQIVAALDAIAADVRLMAPETQETPVTPVVETPPAPAEIAEIEEVEEVITAEVADAEV